MNQKMNIKKRMMLVVLSLLFSLQLASAYVPFLKPNQFRLLHNRFQVEAAFTEEPFQPDFRLDVPYFRMITPQGASEVIPKAAQLKAAVYLEPKVETEGTYRIYTDIYKGRNYQAIETKEGKLYFKGEMEDKVGQPVRVQHYTRAEVYVSKAQPNYKPQSLGVGVEIVPETAPTALKRGEPLRLRVYQNGQPKPNARVVVAYDNEQYQLHKEGDYYDVENIRENSLYTDANGYADFTPDRAGLVLLFVTIHQKLSPQQWESHNASLTLEVQL